MIPGDYNLPSSEEVLKAAADLGVFPTEANIDHVTYMALRQIEDKGRITRPIGIKANLARAAAERIEKERLAKQWCKGCFKLTAAGRAFIESHLEKVRDLNRKKPTV